MRYPEDYQLTRPLWFACLVVAPATAAMAGMLTLSYGDSVGQAVAVGLWVAGFVCLTATLYPRGYVTFAPHLSAPGRSGVSWIICVVGVGGFLALLLTLAS